MPTLPGGLPVVRTAPAPASRAGTARSGVALGWGFGVDEAVRRWPAGLPLLALTSGAGRGQGGGSRSRWSVLTTPGAETRLSAKSADPLAGFPIATLGPGWVDDAGERLPFGSGWIACLHYELGGAIEPRARWRADGEGGEPLGRLWRCEGALVHDHATGRWWRVGGVGDLPDLSREAAAPGRWRTGELRSGTGREAYERGVRRAVELIRAGDIFQANLAHPLRADFEGSARALGAELVRGAGAWYGAILEWEGGACLSISPELFVSADFGTGAVETRPIKGTRPPGCEAELLASEKDRAELVMIVDLMRNDLGRVGRYGSVRVVDARSVERHAGVCHTVGTVSAAMREGVTPADLLRATFPPGSVTGAPKVRAMQVIEELEGFRRGVYCGSIGMLSDCGLSSWNVAIRTATVSGGALEYPVGAGIVADSDPAHEWRETLEKSRGFERVLRGNA